MADFIEKFLSPSLEDILSQPDEDNCVDVLKCTVKLDTTLGDFQRKGGKRMFAKNLAFAMGINKRKIKVTDIKEGSVIVVYDILIDSEMPTKSELNKR